MLSSYEQAIRFMIEKGILNEFQNRVEAIKEETIRHNSFLGVLLQNSKMQYVSKRI
jgi:hypothetical protein